MWTLLIAAALAAVPACGAEPSTASVRGVHLTAWVAGSGPERRAFLAHTEGTLINAVVVPVKESDGEVYIPGVAEAKELGTQRIAIPNPEFLVRDIKARGLRAIARVVVFKDDALARSRPQWAVKDSRGGLWRTRGGSHWMDPYNREVWDYNLAIALAAVKDGFDEVQFDYMRFPADGDTRRCRYSRVDHSSATAVAALDEFLGEAHRRLEAAGAAMSVDVFGLTTSAHNDMGIGQSLRKMARVVDAVSPMMYPSHYAKGSYGLKDPNREPYKIVLWGLRDAKRRVGGAARLRPYLQDFSLGYRYGPQQVRAQLRAARRQGVRSWILWNPLNRYTWSALGPWTAADDAVPAAPAAQASTSAASEPLPEGTTVQDRLEKEE
ncbi:MAG: putative glycoside hydrolase [Elusimicrobia bacterium]|nr:putative glycoside hydrolase [Elusimicrobiota bacterium]